MLFEVLVTECDQFLKLSTKDSATHYVSDVIYTTKTKTSPCTMHRSIFFCLLQILLTVSSLSISTTAFYTLICSSFFHAILFIVCLSFCFLFWCFSTFQYGFVHFVFQYILILFFLYKYVINT